MFAQELAVISQLMHARNCYCSSSSSAASYRIPVGPKSGISAYFRLCLLKALIKSNNFWQTLAAIYVEYCTEWYCSYSLAGATKMKQLSLCFLTGACIQQLSFTYLVLLKFAENNSVVSFFIYSQTRVYFNVTEIPVVMKYLAVIIGKSLKKTKLS